MTVNALEAKLSNPREGGPTFPLAHRLYRLCWTATWAVLASWTPPPLRGWRRILLRLFGAKIAPTAGIYGSARIWDPRNLEMGAHSYLGPDVDCYSMAKIVIEPYALISQGAHLCTGAHDIEDAHFQLYAKPIMIRANAWVAAGAFVGPGVTIGEGAVLGARAVTFKDIPAWSVFVGNPAKFVKARELKSDAGTNHG